MRVVCDNADCGDDCASCDGEGSTEYQTAADAAFDGGGPGSENAVMEDIANGDRDRRGRWIAS